MAHSVQVLSLAKAVPKSSNYVGDSGLFQLLAYNFFLTLQFRADQLAGDFQRFAVLVSKPLRASESSVVG
jgi:hypothetical protein